MSRLTPILLILLLASGAALYVMKDRQDQDAALAPVAEAPKKQARALPPFTQANTISGAYLAGRYAQRHFDWGAAGTFFEQVLHENPKDPALLKRTMVLAMGDGQAEKAISLAQRVQALEKESGALAELFIAISDFKYKNYESAAKHIDAMPPGGLSDFILPLLKGWAAAAMGKNETAILDQNTIHLYHAILIDDYLGQKEQIAQLLSKALEAPDLNPEDMTRIADLYAHVGQIDEAKKLYQNALDQDPENPELADKLEKLARGETDETFTRVKSPEQGVAEALYDMARLLAQEYSDESARVFVQMAIYLNPDLTKARFLLASLEARNERYSDAIAAYRAIAPEDVNYSQARRAAASLLEETGNLEEAEKELKMLASDHQDVDAMMQLGDIRRTHSEFSEAIKAYNKAAEMMGGNIGPDYWQLYYVRGMAYEQNGQWDKAEADLQAALKYQPNHPYILNYLGYAWADMGVNLDEALSMIERAVSARPDDGYITDSLGWVYYKMGQYTEAVPYLEQAVELMPYDSTINDHLGDAYWQVGRHREARFQWERARNHAEDEAMIKTLDEKISNGLPGGAQKKSERTDSAEQPATAQATGQSAQ